MSINSKEHILCFLRFRRMFARTVGWVKSIEVNAFKSCSRPRNFGPLIHGALQNGCRAGLLRYGSYSSAGLLPKDLGKSRTARSPRTSPFSRTEQPNRSLAGSGPKFRRRASHAGLSSSAPCIALRRDDRDVMHDDGIFQMRRTRRPQHHRCLGVMRPSESQSTRALQLAVAIAPNCAPPRARLGTERGSRIRPPIEQVVTDIRPLIVVEPRTSLPEPPPADCESGSGSKPGNV
jgi:hypothetical protein